MKREKERERIGREIIEVEEGERELYRLLVLFLLETVSIEKEKTQKEGERMVVASS